MSKRTYTHITLTKIFGLSLFVCVWSIGTSHADPEDGWDRGVWRKEEEVEEVEEVEEFTIE